jgi:osmotically-inducible protein OsmY
MDRDQTRQRDQYQGERYEDESSSHQGGERTMTYPSQDRQRQGGQSGVERSGSTSSSGLATSAETRGDWQGFVVPYRYYGPGYAGLGYYAVYYQGGEGQGGEEETFDQRNVGQGQGRGAGTGWGPSRSGGGQPGRYGGQSQAQPGQWPSQGGQGASQGGQWGSRSSGGYAGRGPKGYRRSDERIREEISDQFMDNDELDASEIEVMVVEGVVTLTGTVPDRQSKRLAEDIAESGSGVRDVMNQLKVDNEASTRGGRDQDGRTAGAGSSSTGSRTSSGTRSSSRGSSRTTSQSQSASGKGQPVGAATGGAADGATGNGSSRDMSNRESEGRSR